MADMNVHARFSKKEFEKITSPEAFQYARNEGFLEKTGRFFSLSTSFEESQKKAFNRLLKKKYFSPKLKHRSSFSPKLKKVFLGPKLSSFKNVFANNLFSKKSSVNIANIASVENQPLSIAAPTNDDDDDSECNFDAAEIDETIGVVIEYQKKTKRDDNVANVRDSRYDGRDSRYDTFLRLPETNAEISAWYRERGFGASFFEDDDEIPVEFNELELIRLVEVERVAALSWDYVKQEWTDLHRVRDVLMSIRGDRPHFYDFL